MGKIHKAKRSMIVDFSTLLFEPLFTVGYIDFSQVAAYGF